MTQTTLWDETTHAGATLFHEPISRMVRRTDPPTSHAAAEKISKKITDLQINVYAQFKIKGPMTAKECERMERFADYSPSTIRKRISELAAMEPPLLVPTGVERDGCAEYEYCNAKLTVSGERQKGSNT